MNKSVGAIFGKVYVSEKELEIFCRLVSKKMAEKLIKLAQWKIASLAYITFDSSLEKRLLCQICFFFKKNPQSRVCVLCG